LIKTETPTTIEEAAAVIRECAVAGRVVRVRGGGTKLAWTTQLESADEAAVMDTRGLNRIVEQNAGDFTAVVEAGIPLKEAQAVFARAGQMLALDPPLGADDAATIGGVLASNDSGPLRHRYGSVRDLVIGITVVLSDGTIASSGGRVIKNVAGYDLAKLFTGSYGTLGLVARVALRLHPLASRSATLVAESRDADAIAATAIALSRLPLEADCLDVKWSGGSGRLLVRFAGAAAEQRAYSAATHVGALSTPDIVTNDHPLWSDLRTRQRNREGMILKVSGRPTDLQRVIRTANANGGSLVSRAGLGLTWMSLPATADLSAIRTALAPRWCTVLDGAQRVQQPWPELEPGSRVLMQRVKQRFDPNQAFSPGVFAGAI
jgi:glycolate oxidase FAD binding subunit